MREVHLSDEAVAAFADDVLTGQPRERARRHTAVCAECNHAVAVQREAVWALRAAPAPALPTSLLDRLRDLPTTAPISRTPTVFDDRGFPMFPAFGTASSFVPASTRRAQQPDTKRGPKRGEHRAHHVVTRNFVIAAASLAVMGSLTGTALADTGSEEGAPIAPATVSPAAPAVPMSPTQAELARAFTPLHP